jgi:hypothetical protein
MLELNCRGTMVRSNNTLDVPPDVSVTRLAEATRAPDTGVRELKR